MLLRFAPESDAKEALPLHIVSAAEAKGWIAKRSAMHKAWLNAQGFTGKLNSLVILPGKKGTPDGAVLGWGDPATRTRGRFHIARAVEALPEGKWRIMGKLSKDDLSEVALGWLLACYRFDRYRAQSAPNAQLVAPKGVDTNRIEAIAAGEVLIRDLVNTPASDMGPDELEATAVALATEFNAAVQVLRGDDLLAQNFPMIHAVGRASSRAPRLIELNWGSKGPRLTLVGKGVCFDTGGLDLKPAASMGLMKKDMGGSANVLGLAFMIMALELPLRLRVLIPAVENSVSGSAFRPQDILTSRKGLTVEINNTDAEGRLVLADALAYACEDEAPDLLVSMATLTGAARVAVGTDLAAYFTTTEKLSTAIEAGAKAGYDPVWRLPFWEPYETMIEPGIADLDNAPKGGKAGAITAALFLRRFVNKDIAYAHFDIFGWQEQAAPGRPKGAVSQGARALLNALPKALGL